MQNRNYEDFRAHLSPNIAPLFDSLRTYCFSLGKNVAEDLSWYHVYFYTRGIGQFATFLPHEKSIAVSTIATDRMFSMHEVSPVNQYSKCFTAPHVTIKKLKQIILNAHEISISLKPFN